MKKGSTSNMTTHQQAELKALAELPDERTDTSEIPEALDWSDARRGVFYRPVTQQITPRVDSDVVTWFKQHASGTKGYRTDINRALRDHVLRESTNRSVP